MQKTVASSLHPRGCARALGFLLLLILPTFVAYEESLAATVPVGPPAGLSDPLPAPLRTRWVDRCGRGTAGVCGSVTCADTGTCTNQNAPCCTLHYAAGSRSVQAGDRIYVRAGANASDVYNELDSENGKWGYATLAPFVKGTARCAGGANAGWGCTSDAGCPGSTCTYNPVQLVAYPEPDGSRAAIDPRGTTPPTTGGTNCWGGAPGHYAGIDFNISTCGSGIGNDRTECYGGSQEGKPCSSVSDCAGGVACAASPWYWIVDGFTFSNWTYYDDDPTHTNHTAYCTHKPFQVGYDHGCPVTVSITLQNSTFTHNAGGGLIWSRGGAGNRWLHNAVYGNHSHGYTTALNHWEAQDTKRNRTTYMWNNVIHDNADTPPPFCMAQACQDGGSHPAFTCLDGDNAGKPCRGESDCPVGHCGPICYSDPYHNSGTASQGYACPCQGDDQCATGLTCQSIGGGLSGCSANECDCTASTEGRGIIVDRGGAGSSVDIRNNVIYGNEGDCISLFLSDAHGVIANNTCFHNAKKNGTYAELWYAGNYSNVWNNLFVPTAQAACDGNGLEHGTGGHVCSHYMRNDTNDCGGGTVSLGCNPTGIQYYDGGGLWTWGEPSLPATNAEGHNLVFWNSNTTYGTIANPPTFFFGSGAKGQLTDYQAYGTSKGLTRGLNTLGADPLFLSTSPTSPSFLRIAANSPAARAGNAAFAPAFDITGAVRANPPSIGAFEAGAATVTSTTITPVTSSTTTVPATIVPTTSTSIRVTSTTSTTVGSTTITSTLPSTGAGAPPVDWGNDPTTVALWTFEGNSTKNVSTSTRYCNPASDANLSLYNGTMAFDSTNRRQGSASFSFDGNTTLASSADCLRQDGPAQWTLTLWARSTSSSAPYPMMVLNRNESGARFGFFVTYVAANGQTYACLDSNSVDTCSALANNVFKPDGSWHFSATQYTGTQLSYAIDGAAFANPVTVGFTPNTGTYPFQLSHVVGPGTGTGVIGNEDEVWWTDAVLTQQQLCRVRAVGVQGSLGWCAGSAWASCDGDADCGGRAGACNTSFPAGGKRGSCVGNLQTAAQGGPTGCNTAAALGRCDAILTAGSTATTTTTTATTTTRPSATTTTVPAAQTDLGLDASRFLTQYGVQNVQSPVYQVFPATTDASPFNTADTPEVLPCALQSFDTQVLLTSASGGTTVYPQVTVRLYNANGTPIMSTANGSTIDQVVANLAPLQPGATTMADLTAISSVSPDAGVLFQPRDLPRNRAFRMEITVTPFADPQYSRPVSDANPDNDVMSFWLMKAC
jgi:hypothetical protein